MFDKLLDSSTHRSRTGKGITFWAALTIHAVPVGSLVMVPLFLPDAIPKDMMQLAEAALVLPNPLPTPPPPRPEPPRPAANPETHIPRINIHPNQLYEPNTITDNITPPASREELIASLNGGSDGPSIPGGIPGSDLCGTAVETGRTGIVFSDGSADVAPPLPPPPSKTPVPLGGKVLESKLITRVKPIYPLLAKVAHVQGIVVLQVIVSETGNVSSIKVVSGNPLLSKAAVDAVQQWVYSPTLLNDKPIPVVATVTVTFTLSVTA